MYTVGDLCAGAAGGGRGVRAGAEDSQQDAGAFIAAWVSAARACQAAQAGGMTRHRRRHFEEGKQRPKKHRHTAKRIFERPKTSIAFQGGYTIVKDYVRLSRIGSQEMFVPMSHAPGKAQADFGEAVAVISGVEQTVHFIVFDLPHSEDRFVQAFPAETTEVFPEGHVRAFQYFGAVPPAFSMTTPPPAVARILGDDERQKTRDFSELHSPLSFCRELWPPWQLSVDRVIGDAVLKTTSSIGFRTPLTPFREGLVRSQRGFARMI